ncbi:sodium- and chloride-dependent glycine transporter 2 [Aplysia californica]|uniref:Sodium- and chloride-dependent glycine transporter 2 n=1 Tax=Aplysia californica TaxID=6500 RepID=A0ABM0JJH4_APLCA|nr:sodium- and chloride-dependent glycine transporter 2 [Aplysia californica]
MVKYRHKCLLFKIVAPLKLTHLMPMEYSKLADPKTWIEASIQVFYSLGPAWGGLITMASYNKFNNNCMRDAVLLSLLCEGTSVFAGFAIFTILGHMSKTLSVPIETFAKTGPGVAFVVYPEAISYLPLPQLWAVLFFVMLFTLGLDSQFVTIETVLTTLSDMWPRLMKRHEKLIKFGYLILLFLFSLPFASRGGVYLFQLVDWYFAAFTTVVIGIMECIVIAWIYGSDRFRSDVQLMIGSKPPYVFALLWGFWTPGVLLAVFVFTLLKYEAPTFEGYEYGPGEQMLGWAFATVSLLPIPAWAIYLLCKTPGRLSERLRITLTPSSEWEPNDPSLKDQYRMDTKHLRVCNTRCICCK